MSVYINDVEKNIYKGTTIKDMLDKEEYKITYIAVECNGEIIPKAKYESKIINDGDKIEVVSFVGGG